jgi:hypothetical protein
MDNEHHNKTNREKAQAPKSKTMHWCDYCDANYIASGSKCGVCGKISGIRRFKKDW